MSDEEDISALTASFYCNRKRQKKKAPAAKSSKKKKLKRSDAEPLPEPSDAEKAQILASIERVEDRNLQISLWELPCNYRLLPHQFAGVRAIAGVPEDFPGRKGPPKDRGDHDDDPDYDPVFEWAADRLKKAKPRREKDDRGVLVGDVMGLGKTVQAVVAAVLRNAITQAQGRSLKPTLIISPNDAVLSQWQDTLLWAGVEPKYIVRLIPRDTRFKCKPGRFILCNRYDLQTEAKYIFSLTAKNKTRPESALFKNAPKSLFVAMKNQYQSAAGKTKNEYRIEGEKESPFEVVTRLLADYQAKITTTFETVIVDESHFLKNLNSYWGIAAAMLGLHTDRMIPMSGTPYNNSLEDLSTQMVFIDPSLDSAYEKWWVEATKEGAAAQVTKAVAEWNKNHLIRREKDVIAKDLPKKIITNKPVAAYPLELFVYEQYEAKFLLALDRFQKLSDDRGNPLARKRMQEMFQILLAFASMMRMSLIHPLLPAGGRDMSIFFSPSRRHLLKSQEQMNRCVCCKRVVKKEKKAQRKEDQAAFENLEDENLNGEDDDFRDDEGEELEGATSNKGTGDIVPMSPDICQLAGKGLRHFACESCLDELEGGGEACPLCTQLFSRLSLSCGQTELMQKKKTSEKENKKAATKNAAAHTLEPNSMVVPRRIYGKHVFAGGFKASAKLESLVEDFEKIPHDEKCIILSFFKGSLDLMECILSEREIEVARFDGDVSPEDREEELERFKTEPNCRVLLMSVQTGGTGLNVIEASRVMFIDRWFNPFVHHQAEDRAYRFGQKRDVLVTYHDVSSTVDTVMRLINQAKTENSNVILADGSKLGAGVQGLTFKDVGGVLGQALRFTQATRISHIMANATNMMDLLPETSGSLDFTPGGGGASGQPPVFTSMVDAIANMLGYTMAPVVPEPAPSSSRNAIPAETKSVSLPNPPVPPKSEVKPVLQDLSSSRMNATARKSEDGDRKMPPVDMKPKLEPNAAASLSFLDDSDDDSIPGPAVFKTKTEKHA